ncbi:MAG: diaminopimelate decarboxylase [Oscillospiraceae bacterium]|nr:diaminopimelate decarboxylase [Oscillospiraceae bacterium]
MINGDITRLNQFSRFNSVAAARAAEEFGTPIYIYDEAMILNRCQDCLKMPHAYGLTVRYAIKANPNRTLLKIIHDAGLHFDASSLNEVIRAHLAGIPYEKIMLTTQEVYSGQNLDLLKSLLLDGLKYNVCSLRQLYLIGDFACENYIEPGIRIHPGVGSGESATRNTGDEYSCFGIHLSDIDEALKYAWGKWIKFKHVHVHIGSGADTEMWRQNIDIELGIIEKHFKETDSVCFGGGLKEARMPDEQAADIEFLGKYAKTQIEKFNKKHKRKLKMEIEPGTFIVANSGYILTKVIDKKDTAIKSFILTDGGMETNPRPLYYGSQHPIYILSGDGAHVKSSEFSDISGNYSAVVAGKCCESGDCQTLDADGHAISRKMAEPEIGDLAVIGGTGAYCSSLAPFNYNSHTQVPEVLFTSSGDLKLIRKRQTMEQMLENEI